MTIVPSIPTPNESLLLQQVAEGNEQAFAQLMQEYANILASHIFRLTHQRELTEEIVQDVFLKIWQTRESLTEVRNFRTYLYVISRNQALNAIRSLIREKQRFTQWEHSAMASASQEEAGAIREEHYSLLEQAINQLPPQQQKAWLLSRRQGLRYKEIAKQMDLSEETVKKYIQYASLSITRYVEEQLPVILLGIVLAAR